MQRFFKTLRKLKALRSYIILLFCLLGSSSAWALTFTGTVTDSITGETLPFISIRIAGTMYGDETDIDGNFSLNADDTDKLEFTFLGYKTKTYALNKYVNKHMNVKLVPTDYMLKEVQVTSKNSYSKKNNPAVELAKRILAQKNDNRIENANYYQRDTYEKLLLGITDIKEGKATKNLGLSDIVSQSDTSIVSGKKVLMVSLKEKTMTQYYRKSPNTKKQIVTGRQEKGIDDQLFAEGWLTTYMDEMFKDIDIYNSNINIAFKPFVGPLSPIATDFYKFFIKDTISIDGEKYINLGFTPFNSSFFGFMGYITVDDSTLAIKHVNIDIPKNTNINYLDGFHLEQNFELNDDGIMELQDDQLTAEFYLVKGTKGFYAQRSRSFKDYEFNLPNDSILKSFAGTEKVLKDAKKQDSTHWQAYRTDSVQLAQSQVSTTLDKLQNNGFVKGVLFIAELLIKGYLRTGDPSYFDIGPIYTMFSGSTIEGFRLRVGGETTANLSPNFFAKGYMAYGFHDHKMKYGLDFEYSFNQKSYHAREYPVNSIALNYTDDIRTLGENPVGSPTDNWAYSIKRMAIYNMMYYKQLKMQYTYEDMSGFSVNPWIKSETQLPTDSIRFTEVGTGNQFDHLVNNEVGVTLRYAPKEKFVQGRIYRFNLKNPHPVFELTHRASFKDILGTNYGYQTTELKYSQRYFISAFGRIDLTVKAGKIWTGGVAYPYLFSPNANTSFTVMAESFSQVNPLEFVCDQYATIDLGISTNGLLFNLIPGVKKLQLREVFGFKAYWGYLSDKNNPAFDNTLLQFPGGTGTFDPNRLYEPYMEFSVGIDNILKVLRVDYVRRINYLDRPNVAANGVRVSLSFTF